MSSTISIKYAEIIAALFGADWVAYNCNRDTDDISLVHLSGMFDYNYLNGFDNHSWIDGKIYNLCADNEVCTSSFFHELGHYIEAKHYNFDQIALTTLATLRRESFGTKGGFDAAEAIAWCLGYIACHVYIDHQPFHSTLIRPIDQEISKAIFAGNKILMELYENMLLNLSNEIPTDKIYNYFQDYIALGSKLDSIEINNVYSMAA